MMGRGVGGARGRGIPPMRGRGLPPMGMAGRGRAPPSFRQTPLAGSPLPKV